MQLRFRDFVLSWDLDPGRGGVARGPAIRQSGNVRVVRGSRLVAVTVPPDERVIEFAIDPGDGAPASAPRTIVIELVTNRWNAFALSAERRILTALRPGATATRNMVPGDAYRPPRLSVRVGAREPVSLDEWLRLLVPCAPRERRRRLLESLAYTSPLNAATILGEAGESADPQPLRDAHERYRLLLAAPRDPCLVDPDTAAQPYGVPLSGAAQRHDSLLEAFESGLLRRGRPAPPGPAEVQEEAADRVAGRIRRIDRSILRMRSEVDGAAQDALRRRRIADLIMSQLRDIRRGDASVDLEDFDGGRIEVRLDPALTAAQNAEAYYDSARKRDRAATDLPARIEKAVAQRRAMIDLLERIRAGEATEGEIQAALTAPTRRRVVPGESLPYRRYRTRGGLEVRVGRGSAANDALTFHHSRPSDIWLHARDAAGAHVILRWPHKEANPHPRDLADAAVLAALNSRARTSGTVPVDWTRRKYVRKPRKSAPGRVVHERAQTIFVEPDADLEKELRWDPIEDGTAPDG